MRILIFLLSLTFFIPSYSEEFSVSFELGFDIGRKKEITIPSSTKSVSFKASIDMPTSENDVPELTINLLNPRGRKDVWLNLSDKKCMGEYRVEWNASAKGIYQYNTLSNKIQ